MIWKLRPTILLLGLGLLLGACQTYSSLNTINLEYRYDANMPITIQQVVLDAGTNLRLYLAIDAKKILPNAPAQTLLDYYGFTGNLSPSYKSKYIIRRDTLVPQQIFRDKKGIFYAVFNIEKVQNLPFGVIALDIYERGTDRSYVMDVPLDFEPANPISNKYLLFRNGSTIPLIQNYFTPRDTVSIRSLLVKNKTLFIKHYSEETFSASLPPMSVNSTITSKKSLKLLGRFQVSTDRLLQFSESGLYFVQEDTTSNDGFSFIVQENKYPRVTVADELVSPLVYITTREERNRLATSPKPKETLDQFWLDIGGNRDHARNVIRNYYENVEEANRLFTSFEQGWKTDRGMVYIIFGKPDRLLRFDDREEWYYDRNLNDSGLMFAFFKRPTIFTPENYELMRSGDYSHAWFGTVEQWRKGVLRH